MHFTSALYANYPNGKCPDCGEEIPKDISPGEECSNCGHVFWPEEGSEPEEGDYLTEDHIRFYQYGKLVVEVPLDKERSYKDWRSFVKAHMDKGKFWPNVWFISDHGNYLLLSLEEE